MLAGMNLLSLTSSIPKLKGAEDYVSWSNKVSGLLLNFGLEKYLNVKYENPFTSYSSQYFPTNETPFNDDHDEDNMEEDLAQQMLNLAMKTPVKQQRKKEKEVRIEEPSSSATLKASKNVSEGYMTRAKASAMKQLKSAMNLMGLPEDYPTSPAGIKSLENYTNKAVEDIVEEEKKKFENTSQFKRKINPENIPKPAPRSIAFHEIDEFDMRSENMDASEKERLLVRTFIILTIDTHILCTINHINDPFIIWQKLKAKYLTGNVRPGRKMIEDMWKIKLLPGISMADYTDKVVTLGYQIRNVISDQFIMSDEAIIDQLLRGLPDLYFSVIAVVDGNPHWSLSEVVAYLIHHEYKRRNNPR